MALSVGGGGAAYGAANLVVALMALLVLAMSGPAVLHFLHNGPRALLTLVGLTLALPLGQLVPLPPWVWQGLPGRELVTESLVAIGRADHWRPLSVDAIRTSLAFVGLFAPITVIAVGWSLSARALARLPLVLVGVALIEVAWGVVQVFGSDQYGLLYPENPFPGVLFGFFANRNSAGLFLVCMVQLLFALPPTRRAGHVWPIRAAAAAMLVTGVVLTQSRSSMILLVIPFATAALRLARKLMQWGNGIPFRSETGRRLRGGVLIVVIGAAVALPLLDGGRIQTVLERFDHSDAERPMIWEDAGVAAQRYWPVGSGMGTFDEVFQIDESLEFVSPRRAGRAHNDYLELVIESGCVGVSIAAGWAVWLLITMIRATFGPQRRIAVGAGGAVLAIALQSVLDYPLRNQAMLALGSVLVLLLARSTYPSSSVPSALPHGAPPS